MLLLDPKELPDLPKQSIRDFLLAQNYLIKLERNLIEKDNLSEQDQKEKECYDKYYSMIFSKLNIQNIQENFFSERAYLIDEIENRKPLGVEIKKDGKIPNPKDLIKDVNSLKKEINTIVTTNKIDIDSLFTEREKYIFRRKADILEKEEQNQFMPEYDLNKDRYVVTPIQEPNVKQSAPTNKFKYNRYKLEKKNKH